ncbi:MAG: hypothetical protein R2769_06635 [Saprospiraceae bacterium]
MVDQALELLAHCKSESIDRQELSLINLYEALIYESKQSWKACLPLLKNHWNWIPKNQTTLVKMHWCITHTGKSRESVKIHKQVVDHHPYSAWGWFNLANVTEDLCEYEKR